MLRKPKILVVGSFMMDLIASTRQAPKSGETVIGHHSVIGANAFITESVPCCTTVTNREQPLLMKARKAIEAADYPELSKYENEIGEKIIELHDVYAKYGRNI